MSRCVHERNHAPVNVYGICADVLRDAPGLALYHVRLSYGIEECSLTVVYVSHDGDYGRARLEFPVLIDIRFFEKEVLLFEDIHRYVEIEFFGQERRRFVIEGLVHGSPHTHAYKLLY